LSNKQKRFVFDCLSEMVSRRFISIIFRTKSFTWREWILNDLVFSGINWKVRARIVEKRTVLVFQLLVTTKVSVENVDKNDYNVENNDSCFAARFE